jgi:hypothetical protein
MTEQNVTDLVNVKSTLLLAVLERADKALEGLVKSVPYSIKDLLCL